MTIKFVEDATILVDGTPEKLFSKGEVKNLSPESEQRWIRRGVAVEHSGKAAATNTGKKSSKKRAAKADTAANG